MPRAYDLKDETDRMDSIMVALARCRVALGLTQQEVADRAGYHMSNLCAWERGRRSPSLRAVEDIAQVLGARIVVER